MSKTASMRLPGTLLLLAALPMTGLIGAACGSSDSRAVRADGGAGGVADVTAGVGGESLTPTHGGEGGSPAAGESSSAGAAGGEQEPEGGTATGGASSAGAGGVGDALPACDAGSAEACESIDAALSGLRWEIPCTQRLAPAACSATDPAPVVATLAGVPDGSYQVTLRFRGLIELESYTPLPSSGTWVEAATPANDGNNIYSLEISEPAATYYLNAGAHAPYCQAMDEEHTLLVQSGATVTLKASAVDGGQVANVDAGGQPLIVPGVPPAPDAYDGQFVQMDVVSIQRAD